MQPQIVAQSEPGFIQDGPWKPQFGAAKVTLTLLSNGTVAIYNEQGQSTGEVYPAAAVVGGKFGRAVEGMSFTLNGQNKYFAIMPDGGSVATHLISPFLALGSAKKRHQKTQAFFDAVRNVASQPPATPTA